MLEDSINLYVQVIGVKDLMQYTANKEEAVDVNKVRYGYYLNEGVYGKLAFFFVETEELEGILNFLDKSKNDEPKFKSYLWGPTCDSLDVCEFIVKLPKLKLGDWLIFEGVGGSCNSRTDFNFIEPSKDFYYGEFIEEKTE